MKRWLSLRFALSNCNFELFSVHHQATLKVRALLRPQGSPIMTNSKVQRLKNMPKYAAAVRESIFEGLGA